MVGTGVFTTTGYLIEDIGSPMAVLCGWGLGGVIALAGALCYAELGAAIPHNGGEYTLIGRVWHPMLGFMAAMISIVVGFAAPIAGAGLAFGSYVLAAWPGCPLSEPMLALSLVFICTIVHVARVHVGTAMLNIVTLIQMVSVSFVALIGLLYGDISRLSGGPPLGEALLSESFAVGLVFVGYAYAGWNASAYLAGEVERPERNLPLSLVAGSSGVTLLYIALNAGILMAAPAGSLSGRPDVAHVAAQALLGEGAGVVVSSVVAFGLVGSVLALLLTGSRVIEAIGRDYRPLRVLAQRRVGGGPGLSLLLLSALAACIGALAAFDWLLQWVGFVLSASSVLAVLGALWARARLRWVHSPFQVPLLPFVAMIAVVPTIWSMLHTLLSRPEAGFAGLATLFFAALPYLFLRDTS